MKIDIERGVEYHLKMIPKRYRAAELIKVDGLDWSKSFYVCGGVGRGKTHMVYGLLRSQIERLFEKMKNGGRDFTLFNPIMIVNVVDLSNELRNKSFEARAERVESLKVARWLIFDDMGAEYSSEFVEAILYEIIESRYRDDKYTGFTSNLSIGDPEDDEDVLPYDDRIQSRIKGIVGDNVVTIEGKDRRI